jgi:F-type H+-transporting ATPase subunit gamma
MWILYNEYINTISQKIKKLEIMNKADFKKRFYRLSTYDVSEPDHDISMPAFYELYVASQLYYTLLQNAACEQSARMNAMENASKNAGEIVKALNLKYNKARQARITMELVEIISGASAL